MNISLNFFCEFTVKMPHPHSGRGVLHLKTPMRAELNYHRPLRRCVVFSDSLPHFDVLRVRFQIPGCSPDLRRIELAASALADHRTGRNLQKLRLLSILYTNTPSEIKHYMVSCRYLASSLQSANHNLPTTICSSQSAQHNLLITSLKPSKQLELIS